MSHAKAGDCMKESYDANIRRLDIALRVKENFDIVNRAILVQNKRMNFYFVDGYVKDEILEKMVEFILKADIEKGKGTDLQTFANMYISYVEVDIATTLDQMVTAVLSGTILLMVEGYEEGILIDARTYPTRGMSEPEDDKVLRGSRDGFVETMVFNTALIRRRIRDPHLRMEYTSVGSSSKTDLVLCYMEDKVEPDILVRIRETIATINVESLTMAQESLAEALVKGRWISPFPKVRYTERPDSAASNIQEGKIILIVDNSPSVIILPTFLLDFVQEAQDYYMPPITGGYLRLIRILILLVTLFMTPLWFYFNLQPTLVPTWLRIGIIEDAGRFDLLFQLLVLEAGIDALKLASLNTPSSLSSSFSIIGALILGEFAVNAGIFDPEVILYMAFVALATFTSPSYELGYAIKFMRVMLLLMIGIFPMYGLWIGIIVILLVLYTSKTISAQSYLYPIIPLNLKALKSIFVRRKLRHNSK